jgi:hypothetical protein
MRVHPRHRLGGDGRQVRHRAGGGRAALADPLAVALADAVVRADRPAVADGVGFVVTGPRDRNPRAEADTDEDRSVSADVRAQARTDVRTEAGRDTEAHAETHAQADTTTDAAAADRSPDARPDADALRRIAGPVQARRQADQEAQVTP